MWKLDYRIIIEFISNSFKRGITTEETTGLCKINRYLYTSSVDNRLSVNTAALIRIQRFGNCVKRIFFCRAYDTYSRDNLVGSKGINKFHLFAQASDVVIDLFNSLSY